MAAVRETDRTALIDRYVVAKTCCTPTPPTQHLAKDALEVHEVARPSSRRTFVLSTSGGPLGLGASHGHVFAASASAHRGAHGDEVNTATSTLILSVSYDPL